MAPRITRWLAVIGLTAIVSACAHRPAAEPPAPVVAVEDGEAVPEWRVVARDNDETRIDGVADAWRRGLDEASRTRGFRGLIAAEGPLLDPAAALPRPAPPPGPYQCRVIKLGTAGRSGPPFVAYKPFFCYVEAEGPLLTIVKQTGSQRPAGRLYPDGDENRLVFLGTLALGNEDAPLPYGEDPERDMAGVVERVAPFRWRLVIPFPRRESTLDVFELVPVTESARPAAG